MSAAFCAVVSSVMPTLLLVFGSEVDDDAVAVFVKTPAAGRRTWIVTVALPRNAMAPSAQSTLPPAGVHDPWVLVAPTSTEPVGKVSDSTTFVAAFGPLLSTRTT